MEANNTKSHRRCPFISTTATPHLFSHHTEARTLTESRTLSEPPLTLSHPHKKFDSSFSRLIRHRVDSNRVDLKRKRFSSANTPTQSSRSPGRNNCTSIVNRVATPLIAARTKNNRAVGSPVLRLFHYRADQQRLDRERAERHLAISKKQSQASSIDVHT